LLKYLTDPRFFSAMVVLLFLLASIRWAFAGNLKQALYWGAGFVLNFAVTFMRD
jgi:hypothetical protein